MLKIHGAILSKQSNLGMAIFSFIVKKRIVIVKFPGVEALPHLGPVNFTISRRFLMSLDLLGHLED